MLRINRVRIEIKTANENCGGVYGFDERFSHGLNFIASPENTAGKSSVIEAIFYCLGFEEIIGGRNEKVLTAVYKSIIKDGETDWRVLESCAYLEISNGNETITVYRSAKMEGRDSRLVTVYYGDYDSIGKQATPPEDMYLHDSGAATHEKGFHSYLESFLHLQLPLVPTSGNDQKLYLQVVFASMFIEQKRCWIDIFSGMPSFGIRDVKKRVVEFLLGLDTFTNEKERNRLKLLKDAIVSEWKAIFDDIARNAHRESCTVSGLSLKPRIMDKRDYQAINITTVEGKALPDAIAELQETHDSIKRLRPRIIDNFEALNEELKAIEETTASFEKEVLECDAQIALSRSAIAQGERSLEIVRTDLRNNRDAAKLKKMGSATGCQASTDVCPTCNQEIQDSLLRVSDSGAVMSIDENIRHLEGQLALLEFTRDSHRTNIDQLSLVKNDLQSRLITLRRLAQTIRSDIYATETEWSEAIVQKLVAAESKMQRYEQLRVYVLQQLERINDLSLRWKKYREDCEKLPSKTVSDNDLALITALKKHFVANLRKYKYKSAPHFNAVDIPIEICLPTIDGFDMKFDSSASDNIRIIWSFTIALLQTSLEHDGNHPGVLIFDEPAQHSIVTADMESLIRSVLELKSTSQVIVGITLNNDELREFVESIPKTDATIINVGERAFTLLGSLDIRQARLSEYPQIRSFLSDAIFVEPEQSPRKANIQESEISACNEMFGQRKNDICVVAKENGDIIGMAWTQTYSGENGCASEQALEYVVSVMPDFRNKGIGARLLSCLFEELKTNGFVPPSFAIDFYDLLNTHGEQYIIDTLIEETKS